MSQEEKRSESNGPRTQIEDLPPAAEELSAEEVSQVAGGMGVKCIGGQTKTKKENTCTAGTPLLGSDRDYESDTTTVCL